MSEEIRRAFAPGRVNLIGEHTDYTGGLCLPMAIGLGTTASFERLPGSPEVLVRSRLYREPVRVGLDLSATTEAIRAIEPPWGRYAAAVVATLGPKDGGVVEVESDLPVGAGLSSSASFELALSLALGFEEDALSLAKSCQAAEQLAFGSPTGILDQASSALGRAGFAMRLDCHDLTVRYVPLPEEVDIVVVDSGETRAVAETAYEERRLQCLAAEEAIGPLRQAAPGDEKSIRDPLIARRARHVVSENARVDAFAEALAGGDLAEAGRLMDESHASLAGDYEVSTPTLDELASHLRRFEGVFGARLTGAGFGGCVVALTRSGALSTRLARNDHWVVGPAAGARLL